MYILAGNVLFFNGNVIIQFIHYSCSLFSLNHFKR